MSRSITHRSIGCRQTRQSVQELSREGWNVERTNGGHLRLLHPDVESPISIVIGSRDWIAVQVDYGLGGDAPALDQAPRHTRVNLGDLSVRAGNDEAWVSEGVGEFLRRSALADAFTASACGCVHI